MAWEARLFDIPALVAGEDLSGTSSLTGAKDTAGNRTGQYLIAKLQAGVDDGVLHCNALTDKPLGIIQNHPKSGDAVSVRSAGVSKVVAGTTLTAGDEFGTDIAGRAVPKAPTATGANYGQFVLGDVIEGAAAGELATVLVRDPYHIH